MTRTSLLRPTSRWSAHLRRGLVLLASGLSLAALAACDGLSPLARNQCGNGIVEAGEDCDGAGIGDSACSATCRIVCSAEGACPEGWGCGADSICRQPSGALEPFGGAVALPGERLTLADFDGDGRSDLLATQGSTFTVAYLDSQGLLPGTTTLAFTPVDQEPDVPAVGDLDGDGRSDLAVRVNAGLGLLRGGEDRSFLPLPFLRGAPDGAEPTDRVLAINLDSRPSAPGDELVAVRGDGLWLLRTADPSFATPLKMYSFPEGEVPFVTPGASLGNALPGLAVARPGDAHVTVYAPFVYVSNVETGLVEVATNFESAPVMPPVVTSLPPGVTVAGPVHLGIFGLNDSYPADLGVATLQPDGTSAFHVAFNNYQGFTSDPQRLVTDGLFRKLVRVRDGVELTAPPLAVGRFNGDEQHDLVDPEGIHVTVCDPYCGPKWDGLPESPFTQHYTTWALPDAPGGWTGAVTLQDLVFATFFGTDTVTVSDEPGMTFFRQSGELFAVFNIPTQSPVRDLTFGDVNGDGSPDLVFTQVSARATPSEPDLRSLFVSFGDAFGIPGPPEDLGDVGQVDAVLTGAIPGAGTFPTSVDDIYARAADGSGAYYVFRGSTDRVIQSPLELPLVCGAGAPEGVARASAIGRFASAGEVLVSVAFVDEASVWSLWSFAPTSNRSEELCTSLSGPAPLPAAARYELVPVDLDGDGVDELLAHAVDTEQLFVARLAAGAWSVEPITLPTVATSLTVLPDTRDLAFTTSDGVLVLWNEAGELDPTGATTVTLDATLEGCSSETSVPSAPLALTALRLAPEAGRALLVVTEHDTFVVGLEREARALSVGGCASGELGGGGTAITFADVNADGVDDVVLARPGGTRVFAGVPVVQ
jgi:hypothetical protein